MIQFNVLKLRLLAVVRWFLLILPVLVLFYQSHDLSLFQVFLIQGFFSFTILVLEVPTGYVGDRCGWRFSMILGGLLAVLSLAILVLATHFWVFLFAELTAAMSYCFFSGSDSALLYETLLDTNKELTYQSEEGVLLACAFGSEAVAAVVGGLLAYVSLRLPLVIELCVFLLLIPLTVSLVNPKNDKLLVKQNPDVKARRQMRMDFYRIFSFISQSPFLKWTLLCSGFMGFLSLTSIWLMQVYFKDTGLPIYFLGIIWAALNLSRSLTAGWVSFFHARLGTCGIFLLVPSVIAVCSVVMGYYVTLGALFLAVFIQAARGMQLPVVYSLINSRTTSDMRAAVLSFEGMVMRLFYMVLAPLIGLLCDYGSIHVAFYSIAILAAVVGLWFYSRFRAYYPSFREPSSFEDQNPDDLSGPIVIDPSLPRG